MKPFLRQIACMLLAAAASACADAGITTPGTDVTSAPQTGGHAFSEQISLPELQQAAAAGAVRVEVKLRSATAPLVASEIERERVEALQDDERLESRVATVSTTGLSLELGGLTVSFDDATRFRAEGGDTLSLEEFVARVDSLLGAGARPAVEARRPSPASPQAPDDASFVASELEIDDESSEPRIEINVDADNLVAGADSASGVLRVLGLEIALRQGETEVEKQREDARARARFEGVVRSVAVASGSLTLVDGRVIRIVEGTEVETGDGKLATLAAVEAALAAKQIVEAEGRGVVESTAPEVIVAAQIELEVEDEADDVPTGHVRGEVASVDVEAGSFILVDGRVVRVVEGTKLQGDPRLRTLQQVAAALAEKRRITADAKALLETAGPPAAYIALKTHFHDGSEAKEKDKGKGKNNGGTEAEGAVSAVELEARTFALGDGHVVRLTDSTVISQRGDLLTLEAVADSLSKGRVVTAEVKGSLVTEGETQLLVAHTVKWELEEGEETDDESDDAKFEGRVASVDTAAAKVVLTDGTVVRLTTATELHKDGVGTLQQVADAVAAGRVVMAEGKGALEAAGPPRVVVAAKVKFEIEEDD